MRFLVFRLSIDFIGVGFHWVRCTHSCMFHSPFRREGPLEIGRLSDGFKDNSTIIPARLDKGNAFCMIIAPFGRYWDI